MFPRRIVLESLQSQLKTACRRSSNKILLTNASPTPVFTTGVRWISGTPVTLSEQTMVSQTKATTTTTTAPADDKVVVAACGDLDGDGDGDDDGYDSDEQEEMFVDAHKSFAHNMTEWGGPRRGGRLPEPTRFGDWERKGRCSDF
ncbi:MAG: hypothetical protein SGBAC_004366 [Bacillariaceae sp.]